MDTQEVLKRFAMIASLTVEEAAPWITLCEDSICEIKKHVKEGVDMESKERQLNAAAAALSFYKYTLYRASGTGMDSFTAGDISIKSEKKASVQMAYNVWTEARSCVCDLLEDDGFIFERIDSI